MAKIKIDKEFLPEYLDKREQVENKVNSKASTNKISMVFSLWGIILSILNLGMLLSLVSVVISAKYYFAKNLTLSSKWAKYLSIVSVLINLIVMILFRCFGV
jgi:hypothetical protein